MSRRLPKPAGSPKKLRDLKIRPYGVVHIDSAAGVTDWDKAPKENTKKIVQTFKEAAKVALDQKGNNSFVGKLKGYVKTHASALLLGVVAGAAAVGGVVLKKKR